jgi:hypothetical protein
MAKQKKNMSDVRLGVEQETSRGYIMGMDHFCECKTL